MKCNAFRGRLLRYSYVVTPILAACLISACSGDNDPPPSTSSKNLFQPYVMLPTGSSPEAVAIGDVNGDSRNDVVMTTSFFSSTNDYKLLVFLQNTKGELNPPIAYAISGEDGYYPKSAAIGDINGDGKNEVVVGKAGLQIEVFSQDGSGGLVSSAVYPTANSRHIRIVDLNNDDRLDLLGAGYSGGVDVYYQKADGALTVPTTYPAVTSGIQDLEVKDINADGLTDIVLLDEPAVPPKLVVMTQTVGGSFTAHVDYEYSTPFLHSIALGDVTSDGKNDVVTTYGGNYGKLNVFTQGGTDTLSYTEIYDSYDSPESVEIADVNSDARPDVIVLHGGFNTMGIYGQKNDGTLSTEEFYPLPYSTHYNPQGLAVGDINGDRLPDVVIASSGSSGLVVLYHK
jgi:hypothetical protein